MYIAVLNRSSEKIKTHVDGIIVLVIGVPKNFKRTVLDQLVVEYVTCLFWYTAVYARVPATVV